MFAVAAEEENESLTQLLKHSFTCAFYLWETTHCDNMMSEGAEYDTWKHVLHMEGDGNWINWTYIQVQWVNAAGVEINKVFLWLRSDWGSITFIDLSSW